MEDIIEEIVGRFETNSIWTKLRKSPKLMKIITTFSGKVLIHEVNDLLGTHLSDEEVDTLGGWVLLKKFEVKKGETLDAEGFTLKLKLWTGIKLN